MTFIHIRKKISLLFFAFFCVFGLTGCAAQHLTITSLGKQIRSTVPTVDIDRYEPVVYPAGPLPQLSN